MASKYIALHNGHNLHHTAFANVIETNNIWWTVFLTNRKYHIKFSYYSGEIWFYNAQVAAYDAIITIHAAVWMWWIWSEPSDAISSSWNSETKWHHIRCFCESLDISGWLKRPKQCDYDFGTSVLENGIWPEPPTSGNIGHRAKIQSSVRFESGSSKHGKSSDGLRANISVRLRPRKRLMLFIFIVSLPHSELNSNIVIVELSAMELLRWTIVKSQRRENNELLILLRQFFETINLGWIYPLAFGL